MVQAITGRYHTLAVTEDGEVYSWGLNDWGQLGRTSQVSVLVGWGVTGGGLGARS